MRDKLKGMQVLEESGHTETIETSIKIIDMCIHQIFSAKLGVYLLVFNITFLGASTVTYHKILN